MSTFPTTVTPADPADPNPLYWPTAAEAAALAGVHTCTITKLLDKRKLRTHPNVTPRRVDPESLADYLKYRELKKRFAVTAT